MQATTIAAFVPTQDRGVRQPLLRRIVERFRAHRMKAHLAMIDPRLLEDAGLTPGSTATRPGPPLG